MLCALVICFDFEEREKKERKSTARNKPRQFSLNFNYLWKISFRTFNRTFVPQERFTTMNIWQWIAFLSATIASTTFALKKEDCEVCITIVEKFSKSLSDVDRKSPKTIESRFREFCRDTKGKDNRFCYYLGGVEESATGILGELSKPLSWNMPADKVCEKLKKKDSQICDLRYDKQIDFSTVDLKKLKVRDLKKILNDWDEECDGCLEKSDFIKRIEELKPKYVRNEL